MGSTRKLIAGAGEKMQYLVRDFNDNTIRFVLRYPGRIHSEILCEAAKQLVESVEVLHSSFHSTDSTDYWLVHEDYELEDYFQLIETKEDPYEEACKLALTSIGLRDKTQIRCYLVRKMTESVIVLLVSHLCVDGSDGKYLLQKLVEAYNDVLDSGSANGLSVKNGSRAAEQVYSNVNKRDFRSLFKNPMSKVKSEFPYPSKIKGYPNLVQVNIPKTIMDKVNGFAKLHSVTLNDVLLTSCYYAYASLPGKNALEPMSILSMIDLRRHCAGGDSAGICNMTGAFPTTLPVGLKESFSSTLIQIGEQTKAMKSNPLAGLEGMPLLHGATKSLPMKILQPIANKLYGSFTVGLTNLGNIEKESLILGNIEPDMGLFGGPLKKKPGMQVSAVSIGGSCTLCIAGEYTHEDASLLQYMLEKMAEEVQKHALF